MNKKTLYIKTYGCQMNAYDSTRMADLLAPLGYALAQTPESADMVILNTCHIREKASEKVYSEVGRLKLLKESRAAAGGSMLIAVGGCVAQAQGAEMLKRAPAIDIVFGPQNYHELPGLIESALSRKNLSAGARVMATEFLPEDKFDRLPEEGAFQGPSAFLTIQEGCDKFCTFCVVPYTRGAEYSRPVADIVHEATRLARQGTREITLLGQNVNAYHGANHEMSEDGSVSGLGALLRRVAKVEGIDRLRYTTSHPRDVDDALIAAHADLGEVMPFLHLPVQSGSDRILKAMNRQHTAADYAAIVDRLRAARPDLALSSDFIVGYPGETDADFEATMQLIREIGFSQAYSFKYSARPGTPAAGLDGQVSEEIKAERLARLQGELGRQQTAFNESCKGLKLAVLFETLGRHPGQLVGRSPYMQAVSVEVGVDQLDRHMGYVREVDITDVLPNSLAGSLASLDRAAS